MQRESKGTTSLRSGGLSSGIHSLNDGKSNGLDTRTKIIEAAISELMTRGYANFSQKKVADRLKISPGNLTYHFPSRIDLVAAMIDTWYANWEHDFINIVAVRLEASGANIGDFIDWVMESAVVEDNVRIFRELWAMANTDPKVASLLNSLYSKAVATVLSQLGIQQPVAPLHELRILLYVLACVSEGSAAVFGSDRISTKELREAQKMVRSLLEPAFKVALAGSGH